jgi:hypothetical protein
MALYLLPNASMNLIFRNILFTLMATVMLGLSGGIHLTKMQCSNGGKVFLGTEISTCHLQELNTCSEINSKSSCCKLRNQKKEKLPCKTQTIELTYDFDTLISSDENVNNLNELAIFNKLKHVSIGAIIVTRAPQTIQRDKSPPLVTKPILSQIQSFLI